MKHNEIEIIEDDKDLNDRLYSNEEQDERGVQVMQERSD